MQFEQLNHPVPLGPAQTKRASEVIYDQILDLITSGELKPGDRLPPERKMMEMLKRSRPTVREALRMLERAGYIRIIAGGTGAVIQEPSTQNVEQSLEYLLRTSHVSPKEMVEYREVSDITVARWAAERRTEEDIAEMEQLLQTAESHLGNYDEFIKHDPQFHALIARAAKNTVAQLIAQIMLNAIYSAMRNHMENMSEDGRNTMCEKILLMHQHVLNAIINGDADEAERAMRLHLYALRQDLFDPDDLNPQKTNLFIG